MEQERLAVKGRQIAEFDCHGARIVIVADEDAKPLEPGQVPEWVQVGTALRIRRMEEYKAETGHAPTRELIERFDRVMEERLNRFIENPRKYPWKPMGLRAFELEALSVTTDGRASVSHKGEPYIASPLGSRQRMGRY